MNIQLDRDKVTPIGTVGKFFAVVITACEAIHGFRLCC